jgi:hypothetical protein
MSFILSTPSPLTQHPHSVSAEEEGKSVDAEEESKVQGLIQKCFGGGDFKFSHDSRVTLVHMK